MGEEGEDNQSPLLASSSSSALVSVERTGTLWTAIAHIITGVIGAGVLSLAWSVAQLGWIAGPLSMFVFAGITLVSTRLLCDCYMYPDPQYGPNRTKSYMDAVKLYLGEKNHKVCGVIAQESLYGNAIAYVITSASSIKYDSNSYPLRFSLWCVCLLLDESVEIHHDHACGFCGLLLLSSSSPSSFLSVNV